MGNVESKTFVFSDKSLNDRVSDNKDIYSFLTHNYSVVVSIRTLDIVLIWKRLCWYPLLRQYSIPRKLTVVFIPDILPFFLDITTFCQSAW